MSKYIILLDNLKIENNQNSEIFSFKNNCCVGLKRDTYISLVCDAFLSQFNKTINVRWGRDKGENIIIYSYCALKSCKKCYKIHVEKISVQIHQDIEFKVSSSDDQCKHNDPVIRQLKGKERKQIADKAKATSVSEIRKDAILGCKRDSLEQGNLQKIYTQPVIRKALSEVTKIGDKSNNPLHDVFIQVNELKCVYSVDIKKQRFSITMLSDEQIEILKIYATKCKQNQEISRIHYDATGGILASPDIEIKSLFHHILVIPWKFNEKDKNGTFINIGEMISALHTSDKQEIFLRMFLQLASKLIKQKGIKEKYITYEI